MNKKSYSVAAVAAILSISSLVNDSYANSETLSQVSELTLTRSASLYNHLVNILADYCQCDEGDITMSTSLESLGIDSIGFLDLGSIIYFEIEVDLSFEELSELKTVADLYDRILLHNPNAK